jgi:hypothetical protein
MDYSSIPGRTGDDRRDCAVVAVMNAAGLTYPEAFRMMIEAGRRKNRGTHNHITREVLLKCGLTWSRDVSEHYKARTVLAFAAECAEDQTYLVWVSRHILCVKGGRALDWTEGRQHRIQEVRIVYPRLEPEPVPRRARKRREVVRKLAKPKPPAGVIGMIEQCLRVATAERPVTRRDIFAALRSAFPDRNPAALWKTVNCQLPNRMAKERGFTLRNVYYNPADGFYIES